MQVLRERDEVLNCLEKVSKVYNFDNYVIDKIETNKKGEGYLGEIFLITISDQNNQKKLDLVIKAAFKDEIIRQNIPIRESFENEIYAYSTVFPQFEKFLKLKNLNKYKFVPECYHVSIEDRSEVLILENLRTKGFEVFDKQQFLDGEHIRLIFETYGHFHGISLAYKDQYPEEYKQLTDKLKDVYGEFMKVSSFVSNLMQISEIASKLIVARDVEMYKKFEKYITKTPDIFSESLISDDRNSVILHGDCWSNNMMFKYEATDGSAKKLIDMRLLDLQLMKCGNPVCDLSYCLYSGASNEVLDQLDDFLLIYHRCLTETVRKLGSDPEQLLSLEDLKNDWKKYAKFGFIMSMLIIKLRLTKQEDIVDFTDGVALEGNTAFIDAKFDEDEYGLKILNIARHLDDYGAL